MRTHHAHREALSEARGEIYKALGARAVSDWTDSDLSAAIAAPPLFRSMRGRPCGRQGAVRNETESASPAARNARHSGLAVEQRTAVIGAVKLRQKGGGALAYQAAREHASAIWRATVIADRAKTSSLHRVTSGEYPTGATSCLVPAMDECQRWPRHRAQSPTQHGSVHSEHCGKGTLTFWPTSPSSRQAPRPSRVGWFCCNNGTIPDIIAIWIQHR